MGVNRKIIATLLFALLYSFIIGILVLMFVIVPVEALLAKKGISQTVINFTMIFIIGGWAAISIVSAVLFHKRVFKHKKSKNKVIVVILVFFLALASLIVYLLVNTSNPVLERFKGSTSELNEDLTFGNYPDETKLRIIKESGYTGVINLMNPIIPFEKVLMDKEFKTGEQLGLKIYSFPMLPWISENRVSLQGIMDLLKKKRGKYYIHCYLGKHRVNLVKQMLAQQYEEEKGRQTYILPDRLERGRLVYYGNSSIILGPYPTDEEWFNFIYRGRVKEIVSIMDEQNSEDIQWIEKERKSCEDMGLKFSLISLVKDKNGYEGLDELEKKLKSIKDRVYIHSFNNDEKLKVVDSLLKEKAIKKFAEVLPETVMAKRLYGLENSDIPTEIGGSEPRLITSKLLMGALPEENDLEQIKNIGVKTCILLTGRDKKSPEEIERLRNLIRRSGLEYSETEYDSDYTEEIAEQISLDGNISYLMVSVPSMHQVERDLTKGKLIDK